MRQHSPLSYFSLMICSYSIGFLGGVAVDLLLTVGADPAVSRHPLPAVEPRLVACYIGP